MTDTETRKDDETRSDAAEVSDGYHTFAELYAHRRALTAALTSCLPDLSWKSR